MATFLEETIGPEDARKVREHQEDMMTPKVDLGKLRDTIHRGVTIMEELKDEMGQIIAVWISTGRLALDDIDKTRYMVSVARYTIPFEEGFVQYVGSYNKNPRYRELYVWVEGIDDKGLVGFPFDNPRIHTRVILEIVNDLIDRVSDPRSENAG